MSIRIALVGNVDHGKSTIIGRLLSDSGQVLEERKAKVDSLCREQGRKFEYAFLLDALEEEQIQGITIDVTEVAWRNAGKDFLFVDTPGHREFLKKMVGGASNVEAALLVVDACEGISDTFRRQIHILDLLGIQQRIVLLNKMDLTEWSEKIWRQRELEIQQGYSGLPPLVIPAAALSGDNLLERSANMPWYRGLTLAEALMQLNSFPALRTQPLRFFIQDIYRQDEKRIYVGRVETGSLNVGDEIQFAPGFAKTQIRSIEGTPGSESRQTAVSGDAIGITLDPPLFLERGHLGFRPAHPPRSGHLLKADLFWLHSSPLKTGDRLNIKTGTQSQEATVEAIEFVFDAYSENKQESVNSLALFGRISLRFTTPFFFDPFAECEPLGRFVACMEGKVLGGGRWVAQNLFTEKSDILPDEREQRFRHNGMVLWMTGLSGAGKSSIARSLERKLFDAGLSPVVLDGDNLRQGLCRDLGFSMEDRNENLRRVAEVAKLMSEAGLIVITAFISPLESQRQLANAILGNNRFFEIHIDCPIEECVRRDAKGLYAKAKNGKIPDFTGIGSQFERPTSPHLRLFTQQQSVDECADSLFNLIRENQ